MPKLAVLFITLATIAFASASPAAAQSSPWCIITGGESAGVMSCGFVSQAQCMATRIGTDMCVRNPRSGKQPQRRRTRR